MFSKSLSPKYLIFIVFCDTKLYLLKSNILLIIAKLIVIDNFMSFKCLTAIQTDYFGCEYFLTHAKD